MKKFLLGLGVAAVIIVSFIASNADASSTRVSETVKCVFKKYLTFDPLTLCFARNSNGQLFYSVGYGSVDIDVSGNKDEELSWISTCSNDVPTSTLDGTNENVNFNCRPDESGNFGFSSNNISFAEKDGVISMEAENFRSQVGHSRIGNSQASGGTIMQVGESGSLNYEFDVKTPGTWYVWVRTYTTDSDNNGLYLKVNGNDLRHSSGVNDIYLKKTGWSWTPEWQFGESSHKGPITTNLQSGKNTFSIVKRKIERPLIDKIVLTRSNQPPTGFGPAETTATSGATPGTTPVTTPDTTPTGRDFASVTGQKASFLFDKTKTRVMNSLSQKMTDSEFNKIVSRSKANGDNTIYLFLINEANGKWSGFSFYNNHQIGGEINQSEVTRYKKRLDILKANGYKIVFWVRSDDSPHFNPMALTNYKKYHQDVVDTFGSYADGYVIGLEINEYFRDSSVDKTMVADLRSRTTKTVGVHYGRETKWDDRAKISGADIYYKQYGFSSSNGGIPCSEVAQKTANAIQTVSPMKVVAAEYDGSSSKGCGAYGVQAGAIGYGNG
jgi:hypothetical protein